MTRGSACGRVKRVASLLGIAAISAAALPGLAHAGLGDLGQPLSGESVTEAEITKTVAEATQTVLEPASAAAPAAPSTQAPPRLDGEPTLARATEPVSHADTGLARTAGKPVAAVAAAAERAVGAVTNTTDNSTERVTRAVSELTPTLGSALGGVDRTLENTLPAEQRALSPVQDAAARTSPPAANAGAVLERPVSPATTLPRPARLVPPVAPPDAWRAQRDVTQAGPRQQDAFSPGQPAGSARAWAFRPAPNTASAERGARATSSSPRAPISPHDGNLESLLASAGSAGGAAAAVAALLAALLLAAPGLGRLLRPGTASRLLPNPHLAFERPG